MSENKEPRKRHTVHAATPEAACGYIGHMTVDELRAVAAESDFEANCPVCGRIHLSKEEIEEIEKVKFTDSEEYRETVRKAEAGSE